jgi:hypothetical protein
MQNKKIKNEFQEIDNIINNIDSFEKYILKENIEINIKNQLFIKETIPFDLVKKILNLIINKELNDNIYFEFSIKHLINRKILEKFILFIPELKKYYLKCKHEKYLEELNEKKIITILRQLLRIYNFTINSIEKYDNGEKYLLYIIEKKKKIMLKKIDSVINFD